MSGRLQANTFAKTDLDLNYTQGASDVVPEPQNKIGNNVPRCKCSKIFLGGIRGDVLITHMFHNLEWDLKRNEGYGFLRLANMTLTRQYGNNADFSDKCLN